MSRFTVTICVLMLVAAAISMDLPAPPKTGHDQPDLKHPVDMHKHDQTMQHPDMHKHDHLEPPKIPDQKDIKAYQDMQAQTKN